VAPGQFAGAFQDGMVEAIIDHASDVATAHRA